MMWGDIILRHPKHLSRIPCSESKPYALDWTMKRYKKAVRRFDDLAKRLEDDRKAAAGKPLPEPEAFGLALP